MMRLGIVFAFLLAGAPAPGFVDVAIVNNLPGGASEVNWGDYDADGDLDIALHAGHNTLRYTRIYAQAGGVFDHATSAVFPNLAEGPVVFGDYDHDGDLDVLMAGYDGGTSDSRMYRNDGAAFTFLNNGLRGVKGADGQWVDVDNDGDLDVVLIGESYQAPGGDYAQIYRNDGGGAFTLLANLSGIYLGQVSVGDYDRDGDYDLAISGRGIRSRVYRNDNGTFVDLNLTLEPATIQSTMAWGDYDADGDLDFVLSGTDNLGALFCEIYRNDGNDVFTALANASVAPVLLGEFEWGDYDNDGDLDLVTVGCDGALAPITKLYRNDGGGLFVDSGEALTPLLNQSSAAWGDYDGDGDLDLLTGGQETSFAGPSSLKLYRNDLAAANVAPSVPGGLSATPNGSSVTFAWTASTDDHTPAVALTYNLRVGTAPGGQDIMAAQRVPKPGNAQTNLSWTLKNLPPGPLYYSVQAVDGAYRASAWAVESSTPAPTPIQVVSSSLTPPLLTVTLDGPPNPGSVNATSVVLTRGAGIAVTPASITAAGNVISVDLTGVALPADTYQLFVRGTSTGLVSHPGLFAHWHLDENGGTSTADASGNGRTGTLAGGAVWTGGLSGAGVDFVPGQARVTINAGTLAPPWTASMWVRREDSPGIESALLDCDSSLAVGTSLRLEQFNPANRVGYTQYNVADYAFDYTAPENVWTHLVFLGQAGGVSLYVNGVFKDSHNVPIDLFVSYLGGHKASAMQGAMDEVQIYGRALSAVEIAGLAGLEGVVRGLNGPALDGDANGSAGGDFTGSFTIAAPPPPLAASNDLVVGGCGLTGLELLLLLALRRRR
ncbi:MAG TPA: FG-GAP-like repeat-containing protein [Planctomycetota bacterium]